MTALAAEFAAVRAEARREALEEAEKACDPEGEWDCGYEEPAHWCQERIRALKEKKYAQERGGKGQYGVRVEIRRRA